MIKSFDIVAAEATSAKVFQFLCEQAEVDIITFDVTNRMPFQLKRPWVRFSCLPCHNNSSLMRIALYSYEC